MAQFPTRELDIARLAESLSTGLAANREEFPAPPVPLEEFDRLRAVFSERRNASMASVANAAEGTTAKEEARDALVGVMKSYVMYVQAVAGGDGGRLQRFGWGQRRKAARASAPGQPGNLEVVQEGKTWVMLKWTTPVEGGPVRAYRIQRRKPGTTDWIDVGTAMEAEVTLNGQESAVEFEYRVIACNRVGEGPASNAARAVL